MNDAQKFCQYCGTPLAPDAKFCEACGQPVASGPVTSSDETQVNLAPMDYSRPGGLPQQIEPQPPAVEPPPPTSIAAPPPVVAAPPPKTPPYPPYTPPPPPPPKPGRPWWVVALIAVVVVCCLCAAVAAAGYYFFSISTSRIIQQELPIELPEIVVTLPPIPTVEVTIQVPILEAGPTTPTETAVPQEPEPTAEPIAEPTAAPSVSFRGISFSFPPELASAAEGKIVPAVTGADVPPWELAPRYASFTFTGYPLQDTFHEPQIMVYPVEEYAQMSEGVSTLVGDLRSLLASRSTTIPESGLPFLPTWNAAQMMQTYLNYIDFANGSGIRYLTQYGQSAYPIDNKLMFYTFQGLTEDGLYYVVAIFPISNPVLPPAESVDMSGDFLDNFATYVSETEALLDGQPSASFTPTVDMLDELISTLDVRP